MMFRTWIRFLVLGALLVAAERGQGFSLVGPRAPWQTANIGFSQSAAFAATGGPMNLNEEYRWNVPTLHYGFTAEFLTFFGARGEEAIQKAVDLLNDLPSMESVDLDQVQLESLRINHRAQALGLTDLKSTALSLMLQARGVADSTRYVYVIRNRWIFNQTTNYFVIKRNFDPKTLRPSSFVNGTLWTYTIQEPIPQTGAGSWAFNFPVDPLERLLPRTLPVGAIDLVFPPPGSFWTALTRDDVGALKHIYRRSNFNNERALADVTGAGGLATQQPGTFPGAAGPFDFPGNLGATLPGSGPFDFPSNALTNNIGGQVGQGPGVGLGQQQPGSFINPAVRGGIDRINMVRSDFDSLLGVFFNPLTVRFTDTVFTNGQSRSQSLTRTVLQPDIIFDAADLQQGEPGPQRVVAFLSTGAGGWDNSDNLDGIQGDDFGPGVITPPFRITFNNVGPIFFNRQGPGGAFLNEGSISEQSVFAWAVFDGTTNEPIVFPEGTSIRDLERRVR